MVPCTKLYVDSQAIEQTEKYGDQVRFEKPASSLTAAGLDRCWAVVFAEVVHCIIRSKMVPRRKLYVNWHEVEETEKSGDQVKVEKPASPLRAAVGSLLGSSIRSGGSLYGVGWFHANNICVK